MQEPVSRLRPWLALPQGAPLQRTDAFWMLALACAFVAWVTRGFPWIHFHELSPDEGHHLASAALHHAGFHAQAGAASATSPLLTQALSALQRVAPWDVEAGRWLVLASAVLLLVSLGALVARLHGRGAALWTVALLATAPWFVRLSVTVASGLPSLALALAALAVVVVAGGPLWRRVVGAGLLFALALQTAFSAVLLAPVLGLAVWLASEGGAPRSAWRVLAGLATTAVAGWVLVGLFAGQVGPPAWPAPGQTLPVTGGAWGVPEVLRVHALMAWAALAGGLLVALGGRHRRTLWLPLLWLALAAVGLLAGGQTGDSTALPLLPPLAWLGGLAIDRALGGARSLAGRWGRAGALVAGLALLGGAVGLAWQSRTPEPQAAARGALQAQIGRAPAAGAWMVTDTPMLAFRAGFLVPPELNLPPTGRPKARALTAEQVIAAVERWQPQQVSLRHETPAALLAHLDQRYLRVFEHGPLSLWLPYPASATGAEAALVRQRLDQLLDRFAATAVNGAFAGGVSLDGLSRYGDAVSEPIGSGSPFMRPPGSTPRAGTCFLQAHRATGEPRHRLNATLAAGAVMRAQTCRGGWLLASALEPRCGVGEAREEPEIALEDGLTAQAIGFLMDLQALEPDPRQRERLQASIGRALDFLVDKQNGHGAWPLSFGRMSYASHSTLNDDLTTAHVRILLRAQAAYGVPRYRTAALRGIDFLLRTQSARGGWAQQYDEQLAPASARNHEPAALASLETAHAVHTLLYARTLLDDPRLMPALARGAQWLEKSAIGVERWARFYDLKRNRPLYVDPYGAMHRTLDALPEERRESYRWEGRFPEVVSAIALARAAAQGDQALSLARQRLSLVQRLEHQREARAWLAAHADDGQVPLADGKGLIWTREIVQRCDQLLALLR